jgi:ribosomal protein L18E
MIRKNFYLSNNQYRFLRDLNDISISEHIRRAIDEYIDKKRSRKVSVSISKIFEKGGK